LWCCCSFWALDVVVVVNAVAGVAASADIVFILVALDERCLKLGFNSHQFILI